MVVGKLWKCADDLPAFDLKKRSAKVTKAPYRLRKSSGRLWVCASSATGPIPTLPHVMRMKQKSLRFQVNFTIVFTCIIIAFIFAAILYPLEKRRHDSRIRNIHLLLDTIYQQRKEELASGLFARQKHAMAASLAKIAEVEGVAGASMHLPDGAAFVSTRLEFSRKMDGELRKRTSESSVFEPLEIADMSLGAYCVAIETAGQTTGFLRLFYDLSELKQERLFAISIFLTLLATTLLLLTGLLNIMLSNLVIEPVGVLRDALDDLREGHWGKTVDIIANNEIAEMAAAFNEMSGKLREREAALAASRAKSEFLANISHEIRTPLNLILGFSDLLNSSIDDPLRKGYLESIRTSGRGLLTLINDILDLSKIEAGKMDVNYRPVKLSRIFEEVGKIFSLPVERKKLQFILEISDELPEVVLMDEIRLRQILFNLMGNAVKFTDSGFIRLAAEKTGEAESGDTFDMAVEIQDTGIGIPDDAKDEIFESFRQLDDQDEEIYGGTGLGLAISQKLAEMMGGRISVKTGQLRGSVFRLEMPGVRKAKETEISGTTLPCPSAASPAFADQPSQAGTAAGDLPPNVPCSDSTKISPDRPPTVLPEETRRALPQIASELERELADGWRRAFENQNIPDIEKFGVRIKRLGEKYDLDMLTDFAEKLIFHIGSFDVDMIAATLKSFPDLVEYVKDMAEEERNR